MKSYLDYSKLKKFELSDLAGRIVRIEKFISDTEGVELTNAFDCNTGEVFLLSVEHFAKEATNDQ